MSKYKNINERRFIHLAKLTYLQEEKLEKAKLTNKKAFIYLSTLVSL